MRALLAIALVTLAIGARSVSGSSQPARPNFQGSWTLRNGDLAYSPVGSQFAIVQDGETLTITPERPTAVRPAVSYRIDGAEQTWTSATVAGETAIHTAEVRWVSAALTITTRNGGPWSYEDLMVLSLAGPDTLTLVSIATAKSSLPVMITRTFTYDRR